MKKFLFGFFEKIIFLICIFVFCQFPAFFDEYLMRLSGHLAECRKMVNSLEAVAASNHKDLSAYITSFQASHDADVQNFALIMHSFVERQQSLDQAYLALKNGSILAKPFLFIRYMDSDITQETIKSFRMQISFSIETVVYAILGLCLGLLLTRGIPKLFSSPQICTNTRKI